MRKIVFMIVGALFLISFSSCEKAAKDGDSLGGVIEGIALNMPVGLGEPYFDTLEGEIAKALTGTWRQEHLFVLEQSLALYDFYTEKISACDTQIEQNYKALRRFLLLRRTLEQFGIEPQRIKLVWASAAEGVKFAKEVTNFVEEIRQLGPLHWPTAFGNKVPVELPLEEVPV